MMSANNSGGLVGSIAYEALCFIGVHGSSGLPLRDVIFFVEHASVPSRPHLSALANYSMEQYENNRRGLVSEVLMTICSLEKGVHLLKAPQPLMAGGGGGAAPVAEAGSSYKGFPPKFLELLFSSEAAPQYFSEIVVAPTDDLRRRVLGIHTVINPPCAELLNLVCETRGEGVRKTELHKLMVSGNHNAALIDLQQNMHTVESVRVIDMAACLTEDRICLSYLSPRQSWNRLARVKGTDWHDAAAELSGMPPAYILRQKILWAFSCIRRFATKNPQSPLAYITEEAVESMRMPIPRFMCMEDILPFTAEALEEAPFQIAFLSRLLHTAMQKCYQMSVTHRTIMKSLRKAFEARLGDFGIQIVSVPIALLRKLRAESADNSFDGDSDDDLDSGKTSAKHSQRSVCTFPNNPIVVELNTAAVRGGEGADDRLTLFQLQHNGKTPKQIIDFQAKIVTLDTRRPCNLQLVETAYHMRPLLLTGFVPQIRREEKKHGIVRWWRLMDKFPGLEKFTVRELGSKSVDSQADNPLRDNLQPLAMAPLLRYPFSKRARATDFDDAAQWEDDIAHEGFDDESEEDLDEYWISSSIAASAALPSAMDASATTVSDDLAASVTSPPGVDAPDVAAASPASPITAPAAPSAAKKESQHSTPQVASAPAPASSSAKVSPASRKKSATPAKGKAKAEEEPPQAATPVVELTPAADATASAESDNMLLSSAAVDTPAAAAAPATEPALPTPSPAAADAVPALTPPAAVMGASNITIESEEDLAKRMLQFIKDNTLIPSKNVVTTDQLSVMFYRSQIKKAIDFLSATTPPTIASISIRATNKKIVGAIYLHGEEHTEDEITQAVRQYNKASTRRTAVLDGGPAANSGGRGTASVILPATAIVGSAAGPRQPRASRAAGGDKEGGSKSAGGANDASAVGGLGEALRDAKLHTTGLPTSKTSIIERVGTGRNYEARKAQYWRVRNGWDSNIHRRSLRMHLELWRLGLRGATASTAGATPIMSMPRLPLSTLRTRMCLSTFAICFGIGADLADVLPSSVNKEIEWDQSLEELRSDYIKDMYTNPKLFLATILPMLSILSSRGVLHTTPQLSEEMVAKAASLSYEVTVCQQIISTMTITLHVGVKVGSVLSTSPEVVMLAPEVVTTAASATSPLALIAPSSDQFVVFENVHPSTIAANILNLWYSRWGAELAVSFTTGKGQSHNRRRADKKVMTIQATLEKRFENATRALEEASGARSLQGSSAHLDRERELMKMPKMKKRRKESKADSDSDDSDGDSLSSDEESAASDDDSTATEEEDDDARDGHAIRGGRIRFRRDDYIKEIVNEGTVIATNKAAAEGKAVAPISRRGAHLNLEEKIQLERVILGRYPTAPQIVALSIILGTSINDITARFFVRPPLLEVHCMANSDGGGVGGTVGRVVARRTPSDAERAENAAIENTLKQLTIVKTQRGGFGTANRLALPPSTVADAIHVAASNTAGSSPLAVAQQLGTFVKGVLSYSDIFYRLMSDLCGNAKDKLRVATARANAWEETVRALKTCFMNTNRVEARRILAVHTALRDGKISAEKAAADEAAIVAGFGEVRKSVTASHLAPAAGRLLAPNGIAEGDGLRSFTFADVKQLLEGSDDDFAHHKSTRRLELELTDAVDFSEAEMEAAAELLRMLSMSDRIHYVPIVALAAQSRIPLGLLKKAARRKVPLITSTLKASNRDRFNKRLLASLNPCRVAPNILPREYGVDPMMGEEVAADRYDEESLAVRSRNGRSTRRIAHSVFNLVMQSSWTGHINDVTAIVPEAFGDASRYQAPLRSTLDLHRAAVSLWGHIGRTLKENGNSNANANGDDNDEDELHLPLFHVIADDAPTRIASQNFVGLTPQPSAAPENDDLSAFSPFGVPPPQYDASWRLPTADMATASRESLNPSAFVNPARNILTPPPIFTRQLTLNTELFDCPLDESGVDPLHQLQVPSRGDFSVFKHLDGTPHAFIVAACVSKVFDLIMKHPGVCKEALVAQVAEDSLGVWTEWHTQAAIDYLHNGQYISEGNHDAASSSAAAPWSAAEQAVEFSIISNSKRSGILGGGAHQSSPFGSDALRPMGCTYHATMHGISLLRAGSDLPLHPIGSLLK